MVDDECAAAAAIYDCGVAKVPEITKKMVEIGKGNDTQVYSLLNNFIL